MTRKTFIGSAVAAALAPNMAWAKSPEEIRAFLIHLGYNMWCDWVANDVDLSTVEKNRPDVKLRATDENWRACIDHCAKRGMNMVVIDLGEGIVWPSHPELAVAGSWSVEKLRAELARMRGLGLEPIPKVNFSATHNGWLKQYRRMLSTSTYYRVAEDVLRDCWELFDHPRFIHIGCDEETPSHQSNMQMVVVRKGDLWWHDLLHLVKTVEKLGARAWMWSDYGWEHADFVTRCPKSVLHNTWYYDECYGGFDLEKNKTADHDRLKLFYTLRDKGFEQVPCGTNWVSPTRKKANAGAEDIIGSIVRLGRRDLAGRGLKGFMMAPWAALDTPEHLAFNTHGIDPRARISSATAGCLACRGRQLKRASA